MDEQQPKDEEQYINCEQPIQNQNIEWGEIPEVTFSWTHSEADFIKSQIVISGRAFSTKEAAELFDHALARYLHCLQDKLK